MYVCIYIYIYTHTHIHIHISGDITTILAATPSAGDCVASAAQRDSFPVRPTPSLSLSSLYLAVLDQDCQEDVSWGLSQNEHQVENDL